MSLRALLLRLFLSLVLVANGSAWAMAPLRSAAAGPPAHAMAPVAAEAAPSSHHAMPCHGEATPQAATGQGHPMPDPPAPTGCGDHCTCAYLAHALLLPAPLVLPGLPPQAVAFATPVPAHPAPPRGSALRPPIAPGVDGA
jgi:hypothetical protein